MNPYESPIHYTTIQTNRTPLEINFPMRILMAAAVVICFYATTLEAIATAHRSYFISALMPSYVVLFLSGALGCAFNGIIQKSKLTVQISSFIIIICLCIAAGSASELLVFHETKPGLKTGLAIDSLFKYRTNAMIPVWALSFASAGFVFFTSLFDFKNDQN